MGNDGGSIPDRRDLVRNKPKAEQADKANQTRARWFFCALSKRKLQEPVVSCALGKLYNKDSIIEYLLDKSAYGDGEKICGHIRSLKDVKALNLTPNPAPESSNSDRERPQFVCPLTLKEMNGLQPFVYISTCGCVFTHAGLKTVSGGSSPSSSSPPQSASDSDAAEAPKEKGEKQFSLCPQCAAKYSPSEDILNINPCPEEEELIYFAMERKRALEPEKKKSKKRKNKDVSPGRGEADLPPPPAKRLDKRPNLNPSMVATSRAVASSLAMEEAKRKAGMTEAVQSIYGDKDMPKRKETFMTMGTFTRYA